MDYAENSAGEKDLFKQTLSDYLDSVNGNIKGVEIGVLNGSTSSYLLGISPRIYLTGIDPIIPDSMDILLLGDLDKILENTKPYRGRFLFINEYSYNVSSRFDDNVLDFIFIDGSHVYEDVKMDWNTYIPKIKPNGLLYLHDSRMNRNGAPFHAGPSRLADEIIEYDNRVEIIDEAFSLICFRKLNV